ncbi:MAG: nucleoside deaminase [Erysipelotrichaceae bacterium]|nr:nucleoside deaminase [Erysipelotrichaceae bacterium]
MDLNEKYMRAAMKEAYKAELKDEVPIGAVIVYDGKIIARAHNTRQTKQISTHHAEILCIEKACRKLNSWRLEGCDLYVTLEPCPMCAGAIQQSRIRKVVFGAYDPKGGFFGSNFNINEVKGLNHYPEVEGGILKEETAQLLKDFFKKKRERRISE